MGTCLRKNTNATAGAHPWMMGDLILQRNSYKQPDLLLENKKPRLFLLWGTSSLRHHHRAVWRKVWVVYPGAGQVFFSDWILALGLHPSEGGSDLRGKQANLVLFFFFNYIFSQGRGSVGTIFLSCHLKINGGFTAMRQLWSVKRLGDLGWHGLYA